MATMITKMLDVLSVPFELAVEDRVGAAVRDVSDGTGWDVAVTMGARTSEVAVEGGAILTAAGLLRVAVAARSTVAVTEGTALGDGVGPKVTLAIPCETISSNPSARTTGKFLFNWGDSTFSQGIATT